MTNIASQVGKIMATSIYTADNCIPAYQLLWSYSLFWRDVYLEPAWLTPLQEATEGDGIRILRHDQRGPYVSTFLISTRPQTAPVTVAQRVKGRLQYLVRDQRPKAFQRNYGIRSIGSTRRDKLDAYLASQVDRHVKAGEALHELLQPYQLCNPQIDLSSPRSTQHAQYWYNLHVVFVNDWRRHEWHESVFQDMHRVIIDVSDQRNHLLSRGALIPDHVHLTLGCNLHESPADIALAYMNGLSECRGGADVFKYSYFVGTFGEYDLGAVPHT